MDIRKIQELLREYRLDGWLFTDFHGHDFITKEFLHLTERKCTRRLFYYIPVDGEPVKVLSAIEPLLLDHLPGKLHLYRGINGQKDVLGTLFHPGMKIACQYSPEGNVPVASSMDAGLVEYLRSFGPELVSSANLLQYFGAVLTDEQIESHRQAGLIIHRILNKTFAWIRQNLNEGNEINEWMMLKEMERLIAEEPIYMDSPPFFGIDEHACDPGYEPRPVGSKPIREGSRLIIDIAGRLPEEHAVYYDISWCMNVGDQIDPEYQRFFDIVNEARRKALVFIEERLENVKSGAGELPRGCEVDAHLRQYFESLGLDPYLMHRTGHNIGHNCHGIGANLDDYETHDDRFLLPGSMFSIEPGIYTEQYGVRLEFDVHITPEREVKVYGPVQEKILVV
ncbi:MAG: M24 family metallopeptidase [Brotaphodocola sp.]